MQNWKIKLSLFLNYFVFGILLNSVGTVILLVQKSFPDITKSQVAVLEPFKDFSIAIVSFLVTSFITRIGYKKAMLIALAFVVLVCFSVPFSNSFLVIELLFAAVGSSFALIKMSVYGSIGLVTKDEKEHITFMNFIESVFGLGIVLSYFLFPLFIDKSNPGSASWRNVYFLLGGISLAAFLLLLSSPLNEAAAKFTKQANFSDDLRKTYQLVATPAVVVFIICAFLYVLLEQSIMSWLPTFNNNVLKLDEVLSIRMASILAGSMAVGRFLAGVGFKKLNWVLLLSICLLAAAGIVLVCMPVIQQFIATYKGNGITMLADVPLIAFAFPLIGLVIAPIYPALNSVILSSLPKPAHGLMAGLIIVFSAVGGTTGSLITGSIFQYYGGQNAMYFSLVPITLLFIGLLVFSRLQKKALAKAVNSPAKP